MNTGLLRCVEVQHRADTATVGSAITSVRFASCVICALSVLAGDAMAQNGNLPFTQVGEVPFLVTTIEDESPAPKEPVDSIDARFLQMEKELAALKQSLDKTQKDIAPKPATPAPVVYPIVKVTGFFQADAGWFHQDAASIATPGIGDVQDERGFRRARLAAVGKVAANTSYMLEMDFAFNGRPSFMDVWMDMSGVPTLGNVRIGQYRQPFGLNELTSVRELTFLERPLMFGMGPFRQIGAGFHDTTSGENVTWAASVFGSNTDFYGNSVGDRGYGMAERFTAVLSEDTCADFLIHGGFGHSFIATPNNAIQFRNVPEYGGPLGTPYVPPNSIPFFVDTGLIPAENANLFNAEVAGTWGPVHFQSELRYAVVNLSSGGASTFPSFYAQTGYILTGEHRPYNKTSASLGRIKPKCPVGIRCGGIGAWEVAARYSWIDLTKNGVVAPAFGGELRNVTYGLNWYLNDFTRMQLNYIYSDLNRLPVGNSHTDIFALRAQLDF